MGRRKKEREVYGDLLHTFKPTIGMLLRKYLELKVAEKSRIKETPLAPGAVFKPQEDVLKNLPLKYIAIVNDGRVVEMIRLNEEAANHILDENSSLVPFDPQQIVVQVGMAFSDGKFLFEADIPKTNSDFISSETTYEEELEDEKDTI